VQVLFTSGTNVTHAGMDKMDGWGACVCGTAGWPVLSALSGCSRGTGWHMGMLRDNSSREQRLGIYHAVAVCLTQQ
jgi:hypothetical protein